MAASEGETFHFQQQGGKCKLVAEDDFTSFLKGDLKLSDSSRIESLKVQWQKHQRCLRHQRQQEAKVASYLKQHQFHDVNAEKVMSCGFRYTYPIVHAARARDASMVFLLLRSGANPQQKDQWGYTAFDYLQPKEREQVHRLYAQLQFERLGQGTCKSLQAMRAKLAQ
ncbi:unnamed protein product [Effrenium voratum]|nr:unnamed protein product [Effrenium voratum]|mmetsp:Transcript_12074/g.28617  ORF Transcript_12074/g.28617 Transcript_12074/m.28617 type:complete len:168 (+) Transcript_12074:68-571(+)|eukprot:CAMPEP_0181454152 /NCGR_PEP_ID=MMETSP1110-20121109/30089_1 /TAXON_ID=174948 /ORGANISM="Symbiodinium sp., Strain CCMP421" /LENGTH=167 /DNA_ID=CAMNT_0023578485 /DNA_START=44 /DNA_END=547 /DNA_ORIENTATION=+